AEAARDREASRLRDEAAARDREAAARDREAAALRETELMQVIRELRAQQPAVQRPEREVSIDSPSFFSGQRAVRRGAGVELAEELTDSHTLR
ncbi:MAG: hypothetical protein ACOVQX_03660, partial [Legionella sp.]